MKRVFKWIGYVLLTLIMLTVTTVLFFLNSTKTIEWAADRYAPQYGFAYKQISGGLLTGLEVKELTFKDERLLDSLKVGWNPASILYNKVSFSYLEASGLNVENINKVVETFVPTKPEEDNSSFILPFTIGVGEVKLEVDPFEWSGIGFKDILLDGKDIDYNGERVDVNDLFLSIDTNVTTIELSGRIQEKNIRVKKLSILDIDTIAFQDVIEQMIAIKIHEEIVELVEPEVEHYKAGRDHLLPKSVQVDSAIVTVKPADHPQIRLHQGELNATSIKVDIYGIIDLKPDIVQVDALSMLLDTNLSRLSMQSKLQDEKITVESLSLRDIDTIALTKLFESIENNQTAKAETPDINITASPLLPKLLYVKHMNTSIKSATYDPVFVKSAEVNATNVMLNIATLTAESGEINVAAVSSFASLVQHGLIKDNHIESKGYVTAHKKLFETYGLPLNEDAFNTIPLNINIDEKQAVVDFDIEGEKILQAGEGEFNVEHLSLKNQIVYLISEGKLTLANEGNISIPYAKGLHLENLLTLEDGVLDYRGKIDSGKLEGIDTNYTKLLNDLKISYYGDANNIEANIDAENLEGKFVSADFKKGELTLSTKQALLLKNMVSLPKELEPSKVAVDVHVPLDFSNITPLNAKAKIRSNLATIDADVLYDKELKVITKTVFPADSLLRTFSPKLKIDALSPLEADLTMLEKAVHMDIRSKGLRSKVKFNTENKNLEGNMVLGGAEFVFKGNIEKKLSLENSVSSLENLLKKISTIYDFEVPPLDGDVKMSLVLTDMKDVALNLNSNTLIYKTDSKTEHIVNDTMISLGFANSVLSLDKYHTTFQEQKIFATKPSVINIKEGNVEISPLWVNDELKVTGKYNIENKKGELLAYADSLNVSHEKTSLKSRVDIKSTVNDKHTSLKGSFTILGGNINYDMDTKKFDHDRDIVMIKEKKKSQKNPFYDLLETELKIDTQKALLYKNKDANIKATADLLITKKSKGPLKIEGEINILPGSSYRFKGHTLVLKESHIHFTGNPKQPTLDIAASTQIPRAQITIQITGSPASPHFIFSSTPYMNRQEILSMLLFDSLDEGDYHSEEEMSKLMGTSMENSHFSNVGDAVAKSIFSSIGMNIDHIPFIGSSHHAKRNQKTLTSLVSLGEEDKIKRYPIHFYGQKHFDEKTLQKAMGVETGKAYKFWKRENPTIKERLIPTLEASLRNFYDSEGYYNAKISIKQTQTDVTVKIDEKKPVKINTIRIQSDHDIKDIITFKKGSLFTSKEFVTVKSKIIDTMMREGYCNYTLNAKAYVDSHKHKVDIAVKLQKGDICTFGKVTVKGLTDIKDDIVLSRVRAKEGERFDHEKVTKSYDALYALDAFDSIYIDYENKKNNIVPLNITGAEIKQPWYVKGGIGWEGDTGLRLTSEVIRTNLFGDAKQLSLELVYSSIDKLARFSYFAPARFKFLNYYLDLTTQVAYNKFTYTDFTEDKVYARSYVSYNGEHLKLHTGLVLENVDISPFSIAGDTIEVGDESYQLIYPRLQFIYDQRDSPFDPKNGYYFSGSVEYALPYKEEASSFLKYELEARAIITFFDKLTLSAVGKVGAVSEIENAIPASKLFFAGGIDSNRAYGYKRMGVTLSSTTFGKLGGSSMANLSLEANYPLTEDLYGAVFSDNTTLNIESFNLLDEIISSAGIGLRYVTPIGPIKVDFGMNIEDRSQHTLHFQLGQSF